MGDLLRKPETIRDDRRRGALLASTSLLAALAAATAPAPRALAQQVLPTQGSVASGAASIRQSGSAMTITQTSSRAVINWSGFSIGAGDSVTFAQPNAGSATLNRVTGSTTSTIAGQLNANGQVYLVNPNGIAITRSGVVNVGGGFVASTLGITDKNFNDGHLTFNGGGASAAVSNAGTIAAAPGGFVGLLGGSVSNSGVINAPLGKVGLGSAEQATLDLSGDGFLQVALPTNATTADGKALVDVSGSVKAAGGTVAMKAATAANAVRNAINLSGVASARSARALGGSIILGGGDGGDVKVSGRLDASGHKGGGSLAVTGHNVALQNAKLAARGAAGAGGGVAVSGTGAVKLAQAKVDASGATGGGTIAIGGGARGLGSLVHATSVAIDAGSVLQADALANGAGGSISVWSDGLTTVAGALSARGGAASGDGGVIETSGETAQLSGVRVDTTAAHGLTGTWLIDPTDFVIAASGGDIAGSQLSTELATTNVTIKSSQGAGGTAGQIEVDDAVSWSSANKLTLDAYGSVVFNADVSVQGAGSVSLIYGDTAQNGVGSAAGTLQFGMTDSGPLGSLSFNGAGGALSINGADFALLRAEGDFAQMTATPGGNFALAGAISFTNPYADSVVADFYGHLEGLGHSLQNLTVTSSGANVPVGFIGILDAAGSGTAANPPAGSLGVVSNLFLANVNVDGKAATGVGALAGQSYGHVYNSAASGDVAGTGADIGGLVGANAGLVEGGMSSVVVNNNASVGASVGGLVGFNLGAVSGGGASGTVQGDDAVGGLVGQNGGYVNAGSSNFVIGNNFVGGVVGQNNLGRGLFTFDGQDYATGTVIGAFGFGGVFGTNTAGGVVGLNRGTVSFSYFNGPVSGDNATGGLVGENDGSVSNSYAIGPVSGGTNAGGLVGVNDGAIDSSFAMGAVRGATNVGGLVGLEGTPSSTTSVTNSYSTGAVSGTTGVGGLIGTDNGGDDTITNAYWDTLTSGRTTSAGGVGHTTAELQGGAALPLGANFAGGAAGGETDVYPYLTGLFPNGVRAISGFVYDGAGIIPLASGANGAVLVYGDTGGSQSASRNPGTTGANGYYYIFTDPTNFPTGGDVVAYTAADATVGSTNAATYAVSAGANNTQLNVYGATFTETTAAPTYSQLLAGVANAIGGDTTGTGAINGVSFINITETGADFRIDQPISTPAALAIYSANTTLAANVTATGGINFFTPLTIAATSTVDSGTAGTNFFYAITGSTSGAGLTVNGPALLDANVTTNNGALAFNGPLTINFDLTINSGTAATTFGSTIDSGSDAGTLQRSLTATAGAFSFGGAIGSQFSMGAVSFTSASGMTLPSINAVSVLAHTTDAGAGITLAPGTVLTASGNGTAVTLAASGAFVNNSGAGAIVLTGDPPNWLIYSNNPTDDVFGGLNSNNRAIWNTTYPAAAPPTNGNYYIFAFQPTVTFTSINGAKTYGQDATAQVAQDFTVSGIQPGVAGAFLADTPATAYSGAPSVTSAGSAPTATVAGGPYAINVAQGSAAGLNGYALAFVSTGLLSVGREAITVTAAANTKTYDTTTTAAATPTVTTGALYDAATLAETYATPNAGTGITLTPTITFANAAAANNYTITLAPAATGVINPEAITVTATANTKTYDATVTATATPTVTAGTLFDPATLAETYASANAGNGLTLNPTITFANPAAANNYTVTLASARTGIINPEAITVTAVGDTKVFDGTTNSNAVPLLTAGTLFDPATLSESFATSNPGQGIVLNPAIAFVVPNAANNYAITLVPTGRTPPNTGTILPPPFTSIVNDSPSIYVHPDPPFIIPGADSTCGFDQQLPDPSAFADPVAAIQAISTATEQYMQRCRDASQEDIADALDRYADALQIIIQKLPQRLRLQLQHVPAMVHAAATRARAAPTRAAAVRVLRQTVAIVQREISLVRAEDPDSARIRSAVRTGVSGVLNAAAVSLARAEGI